MYYSYDNFKLDIKKILEIAKKPDSIVAISRGGLTLAHFLSIAWDIRRVYSISATSYYNGIQDRSLEIGAVPKIIEKDILVVDEIVDSGKSMSLVMQKLRDKNPNCDFKVATIFYKKSAIYEADYKIREAVEWIDFFWEVDLVDRDFREKRQ